MNKQSKTEYVKKYKTPIIAFALILLVAIIFIIFFCNSKKQEKTQQALFKEEQEQLTDMTVYLDEIAEIVDTNREHLAEAALSQSEATQTLTELSEALTVLEKDLTRIESQIERQKESQITENSKVTAALTELSENQTKIQEQIAATNTAITAILSNLREENGSLFSTAFEKLETLQADFSKMQEDTKSYYDSLTGLITLLQEENDTQYKELTETLLAAQEELSTLIENRFASLQLQLDEDFSALMERLDALHEQITAAETSITDLLLLIEGNNEERQEEIRTAFVNINTAMEQIRADYSNAHMQIQQLIQKLQETEDANHKETLSALTTMESNMTESSLENLNRITNSLQTMEDNFSSSMNKMQNEFSQSFSNLNTDIDKNLSQYNSSMTEQLNQLSTNITNQYQNLTTTINNYDSNQQESFNNLISYINQKLQQVFQYVSSGKKKLASALLTKGVSIREDATFEEIYQAILSISQKLVIGVQQLPGTISYDYHYHVDGNGNQIHSNTSTSPGGCYLQTRHQDYEVVGTHEEERTDTREERTECGCGNSGYAYGEAPCPSCGHHHWGSTCNHASTKHVTYTYYVTVTDYGWVTKNYYDLNCPFSDGQILGAHIIYDESALSAATLMNEEKAYSMPAKIEEKFLRFGEVLQEIIVDIAETEQEETQDKVTEEVTDTIEPGENDATEESEMEETEETETEETEESETEETEENETEEQEILSIPENAALPVEE